MFSKRIFFVLLIAFAVLLAAGVPLAGGQDEPGITVNLTAYEGNPILSVGPSGSWDDGTIWAPAVVFHDGLYHMFYSGGREAWAGNTFAIGYATSTDGLVWEKYAANPVFEADGAGFDAAAVGWNAVLVEGDTWVLYYMGEKIYGAAGPIGRATAPGPTGPWTRSEDPVLLEGSQNEWDVLGVVPDSIVATDQGYAMYYTGGHVIAEMGGMIGMATSPDGITWTKYNDPATTEPPYAESDPVLPIGLEGWRMTNIYESCVLKTVVGWEMFYSEKGLSKGATVATYRIGYATSGDGIQWTKYDDFPVLSYKDDPAAAASFQLAPYSVVVSDSTYFLYYDYHWSSGDGIGVATGTVTRE